MNSEDFFVRLLMAALLGSLIGLEREYHGRPAGLRTHMLVSIGAAMITMSGILVAGMFAESRIPPGAEVSRIVAGVVTGIGFLGAGAIVRTSDFVRGLTTAACIWFVAALGVVIGLGEFLLALSGTGIAILVLVMLPFLEDRLAELQYRDVVITGENREPETLIESCSAFFRKHGVHIQDIDIEIDREEDAISLLFHLRIRKLYDKIGLLSQLSGVQGVIAVRWNRTSSSN
ncbi:MAG: hypothetical protein AVO35_05255 [Candidatus Aegiribacteria sp. MLS_C]|nr:MAG: hypothetical protein AVO35_05255 [Candidatus Aegiribacteria sp. MLS_C]